MTQPDESGCEERVGFLRRIFLWFSICNLQCFWNLNKSAGNPPQNPSCDQTGSAAKSAAKSAARKSATKSAAKSAARNPKSAAAKSAAQPSAPHRIIFAGRPAESECDNLLVSLSYFTRHAGKSRCERRKWLPTFHPASLSTCWLMPEPKWQRQSLV